MTQPGAVTSGGMSKSSTLDTVIEGKKMREIDTLKRIIKFSAAVQSRMPSLDDDALVRSASLIAPNERGEKGVREQHRTVPHLYSS